MTGATTDDISSYIVKVADSERVSKAGCRCASYKVTVPESKFKTISNSDCWLEEHLIEDVVIYCIVCLVLELTRIAINGEPRQFQSKPKWSCVNDFMLRSYR